MKICNKCGTSNDSEQLTCIKCGNLLNNCKEEKKNKLIIVPIVLSIISTIVICYKIKIILDSHQYMGGFAILGYTYIPILIGIFAIIYDVWHSSKIPTILYLIINCIIIVSICRFFIYYWG